MENEQKENEEKINEVVDNQETIEDKDSQEETQEPKTEETTSEETTEEIDELSVAKNDLEKLQKEYDALDTKYKYLAAEYDNYRKRTLSEKADLLQSASGRVLNNLLPVIDDLDRAMTTMQNAEDANAVKEGVELIVKKFQDFLKQNNVVEIEAKDKPFDVDFHEAIAKFPAPSEDMKGKVIDVTQKGYTLNGKVMRFAKVVVGE